MIDWDTELVTHFRKNEPRWTTQFLGGNVFDDPRLTVEHSDIFKILEEPRVYDCIYVDLVDPDMNDPLWTSLFEKLLNWMPEGGVITINAGGCYPWDMQGVDAIKILYSNLNIPDHYISHSKAFVPSFGREWAFVRIIVPSKGTQFGMTYFDVFALDRQSC
jgi:spermidine synthase